MDERTTPGTRGLRLIVEPTMSGHHFNYVRVLVEAAQAADVPVVVLTTRAGHAEYCEKVTGPAGVVGVVVSDDDAATVAGIAAVSRRLRPERVIIPSGDWAALGLLRSLGWHGAGRLRILAIREFGQASGRPLRARVKTVARKMVFMAVSLQPRVWIGLLTSSIRPTRGVLPRVPDPIEFTATDAEAADMRRTLDLSPDVYWFMVAGWLDERKNIPLVARALEMAAGRTDRPLGLALVGTQAPEVREWAAGYTPPPGVRMIEVDRHLSSSELDSLLALADCVVLAHSNDGPSGIMGKAAVAGTRILAAGAPTLRRDARRLGPTASWSPLDPDAVAAQMVAAVAAGPPSHAFPAAGVHRFLETLLWQTD